MKDTRIAILGADGQLGRAFQKLLPAAHFLGHGDHDLTWSVDYQTASLAPLDPALVMNCAAYNDVDGAELDAQMTRDINGYGVGRLAEACAQLGAELVTYSTDYVFDGVPVEGGYTEDHPANPLSVYGMSKRLGELLVEPLGHVLVVRTSWVFGDGPNFVRLMLSLAGQGKSEVTVTDDLHSRPTHARDLATATMAICDLAERPQLIQVANEGEPASKADLAEAAFAVAGRAVSVRRVSSADYNAGRTGLAARPHFSVFNLDLMHQCGVRLPPWRQAMADYLGK